MSALLPLLLAAAPADAAIDVAVIGDVNTSHAEVVAQLEDDTWYDFEATALSAAEAAAVDALLDYDVVVIGDSGWNSNEWDLVFAEALADWVDVGGGVVGTGWLDYAIRGDDGHAELDAVFPIAMPDSDYRYCNTTSELDVVGSRHLVTDGLTVIDLGGSPYVEYSGAAPDGTDGEVLATLAPSKKSWCTGDEADKAGVVVGTYGDGRAVYLGPIYMGITSAYDLDDLRTGDGDQLLEQAVAWAAGLDLTDVDDDGFDSIDAGGLDCDDSDPGINPDAVETWYDGVDADCAGDSDYDADGDGYDSDAHDSGDGVGDDCDDADAGVNPGATDIEDDGIDQDCDGADATSSTGGDTGGDGGADTGGDDTSDDDTSGDDTSDSGDKDEGSSGCVTAPTSGGAVGTFGLFLVALIGLRRRER